MDEFAFHLLDLEKLKMELINSYDILNDCEVQLLKYSENLTCLIHETEKKAKYVLRIYRPGYHDKQEMLGELIWIRQLNLDTDLKMAAILPGKDGELIQNLSISEAGKTCLHAALFEYIPGENLRGISESELFYYMGKIGEITAKLHLHVSKWREAAEVKRFSWNLEDLTGASARWGDFSEMRTLTKWQKERYSSAITVIEDRLKCYGKSKDRYGLIHSDLNINNILVNDNGIYVLDFDDCGFGWFLYDLSTSVLEYFGEILENCIQFWLEGYQRYRALSKEDLEEIYTFLILRKIVRVGWIATHGDSDTVKKVEMDYYDKTAEMADYFVKKYMG